MINRHDELLLKDLKLQPIWLCFGYMALGIAATLIGLLTEGPLSKTLCVGGGFLVALGAEKLVSRRIRSAALNLVSTKPTGD